MYNINNYIALIQDFLESRISALEFEYNYLKLFKNEQGGMSDEEYFILEGVFEAVDEFCADPALRSKTSLDEEQLREECQAALGKLRRLLKE